LVQVAQAAGIVTYVALVASVLCHDGITRRTTELLIMKRIVAWAFLLPTVALAQESNEISYDYFDFDYFRTDWDSGAIEQAGEGWAGRFSIGIRDHVYLGGEYRAWDVDGVDGGSTFKRLGFGVHGDIGKRWSLFGEAGFKSLDLDLGSGNMKDAPGYIAGGARWYVGQGYELRVGADYSNVGKGTPTGAGEVSVTVGGDIYLTDVATFAIDVTTNDDHTTTFMLGMRFYHKKDRVNLRQTR
jgi:hypothetical protein